MQSCSSYRTPDVDKTLGMEWEMLLPNTWNKRTYYGFWYCTYDGSIDEDRWSANRGREMVSQPLTASWLKKEINRINKKFNGLNHHNDSCGIHIHVNRKWATKKRVAAISKFLVGIGMSDYEYAFGRMPNSYCQHQSVSASIGRYCALNTTPHSTVEFRMFRSGDAEWAKYCVDCVVYLMENAYHLNIDAFYAFVDLNKPT